MGLFDLVNNIFGSFRDFASSATDFNCSQCIKCKQCIKTLSNGEQVRIFTCPGVDFNLCDDEYIDSILPQANTGLSLEYLEAYNKNREAIYDYLYKQNIIYVESAIPLSDKYCTPITSLNQLSHFPKACSCPKFRPFINTSNIVTTNDALLSSAYPEISDFDNLSKEDKMIITQRYDW